MVIALYARVSSQRQEKEETIETQLQYARDWARLNRHLIPDGCFYVDEAVSGTVDLKEREEGRRLLGDAQDGRLKSLGVEGVAFYRLDRLGRNVLVIYTAIDALRKFGLDVLSMTEQFNSKEQFGRLMIGFLALLAEWERESLLSRCRDGKDRVAREGKWGGGRPRYGYKLQDGRPVVRPDIAPLVMDMFRSYVMDGLAMQRLCDSLNERGIPNPAHTRGETEKKGKRCSPIWYPGTLRLLLGDPIYKGETEWYGVPQTVQAIVPADLWEQAQVRMRENKQWKTEQWDQRRDYLLRGLVYCECGRSCQGTNWTNGRKLSDDQHCYKCRNGLLTKKRRAFGPDGEVVERCTMPYLPCRIEHEILAKCREFLEQPDLLRRVLQEQAGGAAEQAERLRQEMYHKQAARTAKHEEWQRMRAAHRKGIINDEELAEDGEGIKREREELTEQINHLSERLAHLDAERGQLEDAERLLQGMRAGQLTNREIILGLVRRVTIIRGPDGKGHARVDWWPSESALDGSSTGTSHCTFVIRYLYSGRDGLRLAA